jgi:CpeT/CpcT family (DUF1001)
MLVLKLKNSALISIFILFACSPSHRPNFGDYKLTHQLESWMTGQFSSKAQAENDSAYYPIELRMFPIWKNRKDGPWLYIEQAVEGATNRPYRQRVYQLRLMDSKRFESKVYTISYPLRFAMASPEHPLFKQITPDSLQLRNGCSVFLEWTGKSFNGSTKGAYCASDLRGASYATSKVSIMADRMESWDQGFDNNGIQVWGAIKGPYVFIKENNVEK